QHARVIRLGCHLGELSVDEHLGSKETFGAYDGDKGGDAALHAERNELGETGPPDCGFAADDQELDSVTQFVLGRYVVRLWCDENATSIRAPFVIESWQQPPTAEKFAARIRAGFVDTTTTARAVLADC